MGYFKKSTKIVYIIRTMCKYLCSERLNFFVDCDIILLEANTIHSGDYNYYEDQNISNCFDTFHVRGSMRMCSVKS